MDADKRVFLSLLLPCVGERRDDTRRKGPAPSPRIGTERHNQFSISTNLNTLSDGK